MAKRKQQSGNENDKGKSLLNKKDLYLSKKRTKKLQLNKKYKKSDNLILRKKGQFSQLKKSNAKKLIKQKKKTLSKLQKFHEILGASKPADPIEEALHHTIFGCDAEDLEKSVESQSGKVPKVQKRPAWEDDDDENLLVQEKAGKLINCHRSVSLRGGEKYTDFVQEKFKKIVGSPKWADLEKDQASGSSEDESDDELLQKTGNFICPSKTLPKGTIGIRKCPSLVDENLKGATIKSVEFHPTSKVALIAGTNGTADLFQIDGKINSKIQSVYFEQFPIHTARFTVDGNEIIAGSNMFGYFYTYDMISGKIIRIPWDKGMEQRNIRKFLISPDGKYLAIYGRYGNIHLVTAKTKEWIGSLKMNGEVIAVTFNKDGSKMYSHGNTGEVYVWDMSTRTCIHKFVDEGCVTGTSLVLSPNDQFLAAGSDSGVVNIYDNTCLLTNSTPQPFKVVMNLTTEITQMKFNCSSEILAISSSRKNSAVRLVHFPSMSVFSNFPLRVQQSPLKFIHSLDISTNSGYMCFGNNVGTAHIYRLKHYHNY